jgi:hypothetical protein
MEEEEKSCVIFEDYRAKNRENQQGETEMMQSTSTMKLAMEIRINLRDNPSYWTRKVHAVKLYRLKLAGMCALCTRFICDSNHSSISDDVSPAQSTELFLR